MVRFVVFVVVMALCIIAIKFGGGIGAVLQAVETTPVTVTEKVSKISDGDVENIKPSVLFVSQKNLPYNKHCHNYQSAHCVQAFQMLRQLAAGCYRTVRS